MPAGRDTARVLVVDLGAQYAQLIARRVREAHVYSEIVSRDITAAEVKELRPAGIILSGGPASVYADDAYEIDPGILAVLASCGRLALVFRPEVEPGDQHIQELRLVAPAEQLDGLRDGVAHPGVVEAVEPEAGGEEEAKSEE